MLGAVWVEHGCAHRFAVSGAELEDVAGLDTADDLDCRTALGTRLTLSDFAQVSPSSDVHVAVDRNAGVVPIVLVGARGQAGSSGERVVGDDLEIVNPDGTERSRHGAKAVLCFLGGGGSEFDRAGRVLQLLEVELVIASHEGEGDLAVEDHHHRLDLMLGRGAALDLLQRLDRSHPGGGETGEFGDVSVLNCGKGRRGPLDVGGVRAARADDDIVFTSGGGDHELGGSGAAHGTGTGVNGNSGKPHPSEDLHVRGVVLVERFIEAGLIEIERIGVLHREFADAKQPTLGSGFISELGVDLVPDLWECLVGGDLGCEDGEHLFFGDPQNRGCALAVVEAEHLVAHDLEAARLFPQ